MTKIVIDFNRSLDPKLFERCIKNDLPKITTDIVFMLSFSDNPQTEYNSLIITKSDEWYLTHQTTSQLFKSL